MHCDNCSLHHQAAPNETAPSPTTGVSTSVQVSVSILPLNVSKPYNIKLFIISTLILLIKGPTFQG